MGLPTIPLRFLLYLNTSYYVFPLCSFSWLYLKKKKNQHWQAAQWAWQIGEVARLHYITLFTHPHDVFSSWQNKKDTQLKQKKADDDDDDDGGLS